MEDPPTTTCPMCGKQRERNPDGPECTCDFERRTIVVTMKERAAHIECDDKGLAIVTTCENQKEEEEESLSGEDEEEGSWEEEEEDESSSFEELIDKPSRAMVGILDRALIETHMAHMAQRRLAYAKAANENPETPGDSGVVAGKFSLDDDDDSSSSLGTMNDEDLHRGCKPNLPPPQVSSYDLPEAYKGKSQILEDALSELFIPKEPATRSDVCRVCDSLWIDEEGLIRFLQAEWLQIVRRMAEEAKANGTQLTAAMIKEARAKWEDGMLKEAVERYHWEEPTKEVDAEVSCFDRNARCYIRRTFTITDPKTGKQKFVRCHFYGKELLESSVVSSLIDNYHARGCKCCECNVEEEEEDDDDDGTPPPALFYYCGKHQAEGEGECEKCAEDELPTCDKHGSYNRALAECPGCVIVASESRVRIPIDPVSRISNTKTGKPVCERCAEADRRVEERLAERLKKEQLEAEVCARIGGRILRPEPRVPCAVCDEAAFEMYTQNPDTGVRTYMKEAHEPKEHECPRSKKTAPRGRGEFEHDFVTTREGRAWLDADTECRKAWGLPDLSSDVATTRKIEPDRITKPGEYRLLKWNDPITDDVSATIRDIQIYDEMEEKQAPVVDDGGPPVKWAKRVAFTIEHDIERPVRNAQGEIVYTWCENEQMEEDKPFITWYRLNELPPDVLQTMRENLQPQNTIEIVTVPGDPSVDWVKCSMWPPEVMAISGGYDYAPVKLDDDEDDSSSSSSSSDHDERDKLNAARASMKQYAEATLAMYSKLAQEMEKYYDEVRRGVGRENAMTRELNPLQLAHMHDELKSFLKQKEEEEEDHGIGWSRGTLSPESLKKFARQQIVTEKLLDEYAKKYPRGVAFPETTEPVKPDGDFVSPPPKTTDDEMERIRAVAKEMKNRKRDAAFNALRVKELEKYKAEAEEEKKKSEPVSIICADDTIVRTELITFPGDSGRDAILVIPRSVGKTRVMNCKRVFRGHGDPPPIPEKQKMAEEDAKPENDSNNKRERDGEEEQEKEDERVKQLSRLLTPGESDRMRFEEGPPKYMDVEEPPEAYTRIIDETHKQMKEFAKEYDEAKKEGTIPPPDHVRVFDENEHVGFRDIHVDDLPLDLRYFYKNAWGKEKKDKKPHADPLIACLQALKDNDEEEILRLRREHDMQQMLDALKGKGLEKFLEHNMPVFKDPVTLAGILQHMVCEMPDTFGVTDDTLMTLTNVLYAGNVEEQQTALAHVCGAIGQTTKLHDAHQRFTTAICFVLTQAYLKGKRPN